MKKKDKVLVIIPCFNEEKNIELLIKNLKTNYKHYNTLVIDDCSEDKTFFVASKISNSVSHVCNLGIGGAVQTGIKYANIKNYDYCVQIDGDLQHDPKFIEVLLKKSKQSKSSLTIGSRYFYKRDFSKNFLRVFGSLFISILLRSLFDKLKITDPTSGLRLMDKKAIKFFSDNYPQDYPEPISIALLSKKNYLKITEVSVKMTDRKFGKSSIGGIDSLLYMFKISINILMIKFFLEK